jgi:hypothetical protein
LFLEFKLWGNLVAMATARNNRKKKENTFLQDYKA